MGKKLSVHERHPTIDGSALCGKTTDDYGLKFVSYGKPATCRACITKAKKLGMLQ